MVSGKLPPIKIPPIKSIIKVQQSGMPSALHRLMEKAFNFVNDILSILNG